MTSISPAKTELSPLSLAYSQNHGRTPTNLRLDAALEKARGNAKLAAELAEILLGVRPRLEPPRATTGKGLLALVDQAAVDIEQAVDDTRAALDLIREQIWKART
jgi:hypothetical protein